MTAQQDTVLATIRAHHDRLGRTMSDHTVTIAHSIDRLMSPADRQAALVAFCTTEILPHALAEEETLYSVADDLPATKLLVKAMRDEHVQLREMVDTLGEANAPGEIVSAAAGLNTLFRSHLKKENELLLPALVDAGVDLGALLEGMHEILGEPAEQGCGCGGCGCGAQDGAAEDVGAVVGELDVRGQLPARRHEQIFAAFGTLAAGTEFTLVNDHDPKPLYFQFADRHPGEFTWEYAEAGPAVWRVRIGRP